MCGRPIVRKYILSLSPALFVPMSLYHLVLTSFIPDATIKRIIVEMRGSMEPLQRAILDWDTHRHCRIGRVCGGLSRK